MDSLKNFYSHGVFEQRYNATYIALIPKNIVAKELVDFRQPYRHCLQATLEVLIVVAVLIANESVDSRIKQKKQRILCKLDHDALIMGFGGKWIK